jgi:hypothetical protein
MSWVGGNGRSAGARLFRAAPINQTEGIVTDLQDFSRMLFAAAD